MPWNPALNQLRDALAELYPDVADARRVAASALLPLSGISLQGQARTIWQSILEEAVKQDCVKGLIAAAMTEYGQNPALVAAVAAYREATTRGKRQLQQKVDSPKPPTDPTIGEFLSVGFVVVALLGFYLYFQDDLCIAKAQKLVFVSAMAGLVLSIFFVVQRRPYRIVWILLPCLNMLLSVSLGCPWALDSPLGLWLIAFVTLAIVDYVRFLNAGH